MAQEDGGFDALGPHGRRQSVHDLGCQFAQGRVDDRGVLALQQADASDLVGQGDGYPVPEFLGQDASDEEENEFVGFTKDGNLIVGNYSKAELKEKDVVEGISFGPALIVNGEKMITHGDGGWGVGPRTAIGQRKDGTVLFLVIDGRQPGYSVGATLRDIQNIMYEEGAVIAANLDGGSSSTLYYNGKVINKPADLLGERMIPTAFVVK